MTLSFDQLAEQFDRQRALRPVAREALVEYVNRLIPEGRGSIFEPGIGTGRIALPLARAAHHVSGIDISESMLARCRANANELGVGNRVRVERGDATALTFPDDAFDLGVVASLLYLVPAWERVLDELGRVIRPSGAILFLREEARWDQPMQEWLDVWRMLEAEYGIRHEPMAPDDGAVDAAMAQRGYTLVTHELAAWTVPQTVAARRAGYGAGTRKLYPDMPDELWAELCARYLEIMATRQPNGDAMLAGRYHLLVTEAHLP